ncbi:MAG: hypothetical protein QXO99_04895 [Candidatus Methanomethylicia archaeon]
MTSEFKCPICGEDFNQVDKLDKHLREKHGVKVKLKRLEHPKRWFKP